MARRYETITELYHKTIAGLATPQAWQSFLTTACHNFRLPFDEQVLLYAQRPNATAVLTIDGRNGWNQRFGRWVNRGATGIAVFDGDSIGRSRLKYYFDISDTHESRFSRPVPIWTMRPEYESAVVEALENSFGELVDKNSFAAALLSASQNAVQDNMPDYLAELKYYKENSFLEELDDLNIEVEYRRALENSIGFMLLTRCGIDPAEYFTEDDFRDIADFSTPETLNALGTATGDIGQMCLSVISRTVPPLQRQAQRETGTFAPVPNIQYSETENRTTTPERSENHERTDLHDAERIPTARSASAPGAGNAPWEIRIAEEDIPEAAPQSDLHESADIGQTEPTSDGDRADSTLPDGIANRPDGESRGRDGGAESQRPDEVDRTDEQHSERSGGADSERTDLPLNPESMENAGGDELPAFLNETLIMAIISNKDDDLKYKKQQIELYFSIHPEETERAEYLKSAYQDRYTEIVVDGVRVGYKPQENGLLMWEGAYLSRTSESVFSWSVVAEWTAQLIDKKEYFINTQITPPKFQESQQLTLFDLADFNTPAQEVVGQFSFMPRPQLSQQIIDEALCIGSNEPQSRLIICAYFMKDHTMEENAQFLAAHYGENGAGFYVNDRQYALWYNTDGIRIASGDSAQGRNVALLTWEQAAKRIRELLDLGRYMPQSELDMVSDHELRTLADRMLLLSRDISEEYWDAGYLPTMRLIHTATIKSAQQSGVSVRQTTKSTGNVVANVRKGTIKTASRSIKSAERTASAAAKATQATSAAQKSALVAAKTSKRTAQAAQTAAKRTAEATKAAAKGTVSAVKGIIAGTKALVSALLAGGWISVMIILIVVLLGCAVSLFGGGSSNSYTPVSAEVEAYEPLIRQYASQYGIPEYVELIKAVMMQESGGRGLDPMQAAEGSFNTRYPHEPNGIQDPEYSIQCGVQELKAAIISAKVENPVDMERIKLALQGYNFGNGYISWAVSNYGGYSYANAVEFSARQAERLGWSSYGDTQYPNHVLRYYPYGRAFTAGSNQVIVEVALTQLGNEGGAPYWSWYGFDSRVEWCACFVSWCADQCGYIESGVIPKFSACVDGVSWFRSNGQWQDRNYEPQAGDIIFFDWDGDGTSDHVGIVEKGENGVVYTVEGNSGDACREREYSVGSGSILGYGVPAY